MYFEYLQNHYDILSRLAMTLVHSLWQGALIFTVLQIILSQLKSSTASLRYSLFNLALIALLSSAVLTFYFLGSGARIFGGDIFAASSYILTVGDPQMFPSFNSSDSVNYVMQWGVYLSTFWLAGVIIFLVKFLVDFYWALSLRRSGLTAVGEDVVHLCDELSMKIGLSKHVRIFESLHIDVPLVVGHIKPYILLPVGAMMHLSPLELEAVILHELSHIKRNDFIANILLMFTEVVLFYHPVFWWLKKKINEERENRCDDVVISHVPPHNYAKALLKMEESRHQIRLAIALKDNNKFHLLKRIKRICMKSNHEFKVEIGRVVTALLLVGAFTVISFGDTKSLEKSLSSEEVPTIVMLVDESPEPNMSLPVPADVELSETVEDFSEPDISMKPDIDTVPPSMPNIGDYISAEISEELQRDLEKYQEEMMKWQEEMMAGKEQMLQQQIAIAQEMEIEKTMLKMQKVQKELMEQEFQQKMLREEAVRQTMEKLQEMEIKMAEESLVKAKQQQEMMQVKMQKLQESLREAQEVHAEEIKSKMNAIEEQQKVKEKEMKVKMEQLKKREKELKKLGEAHKLRMESMHKELLQLLKAEGYSGDFQNMNWDLEGGILRLNQEELSRDLSEKCLEILKKYDFNLDGAAWQIKKQK